MGIDQGNVSETEDWKSVYQRVIEETTPKPIEPVVIEDIESLNNSMASLPKRTKSILTSVYDLGGTITNKMINQLYTLSSQNFDPLDAFSINSVGLNKAIDYCREADKNFSDSSVYRHYFYFEQGDLRILSDYDRVA